MNILHSIAGLDPASGGPSRSSLELVRGLNEAGCRSRLLTTCRDMAATDGIADLLLRLPDDTRTPYGYSGNFRRFFAGPEAAAYEIYHTHGVWMHINHLTAVAGRKRGIPYLISPRGMLYPQSLQCKALRKKLMMRLLFRRDLEGAACLHATCEEERTHLRALGMRNPVAVIPNPVAIPAICPPPPPEAERRRIGFLGRLHPRKNVDRLIEAWSRISAGFPDSELVIIGNGSPEYEFLLKKMVVQLGLQNVRFRGFLDGDEKFAALASMRALVVPSDFENFGMIVPEALGVGTPVITSRGTPWEILDTDRCGWWIANDVETLAVGIKTALELPYETILEMGRNGRALAEREYAATGIARQMIWLYQWILGHADRPAFVSVY